MTIGKVIRKYRKEKGLTQEEMAIRLGVSTPAVNKWEKDNTLPDISLLVPIARLFGISTDELLSFKDDITDKEIDIFIKELDRRLKQEPFEDVFADAKKKIEEYPCNEKLKWQVAAVLNAARLLNEVDNSDQYDEAIRSWFSGLLGSEDLSIRKSAAESLFHYYCRKEDYQTAEKYLQYYSEDNPERKVLQANIFAKTGRIINSTKGSIRNRQIEAAAKKGIYTYDAIVKISKTLSEDSDISKAISNRLQFLFVDEYQDIDKYGHNIVMSLLKRKNTEISLVGDPDQSIYRFRYGQSQIGEQAPKDGKQPLREMIALCDGNKAEKGKKIVYGFEPSDGNDEVIKDDGIHCLSIHKSKGLEADAVLVIAQNEKEFLKWLNMTKSNMKSDTDEDYRLGYVAFTRARKVLLIACSDKVDISNIKKSVNILAV